MLNRLRPTALLLIAVLGLSACAQGPFGGRDDGGSDFGAGGAGSAIGDGSVSDPTSIAYFNQSVGDRILFAVDQSTLSAQAQTVLDGQAAWLLANTAYTAIIEGHADEQGTREYNLALGARRASSVRDYLALQGVPDTRMRTISYGKERPLEICSQESCYAQNRRAVTVLSAGQGV